MSKRILAVFLLVGVLAGSNAFASRARQLVMGTADRMGVLSGGSHGSFYYDDNYNVFYNPSYANDFKNWASIERSNSGTATSGEGGFVANVSNLNVGFFFNRGDAVNGAYAAAGAGALTPTRPWDLFVAGDMGVKWGLGITRATAFTDANNNSNDTTLEACVQVMDFDPFVTLALGSKVVAGGADNKLTNFTIGTKYHWGEWTPFAAFMTQKFTTAAGAETKTTRFGGGVGRNTKVTDGVKLNYALSYWEGVIPVDMSVEGDMTDWLMLRAGLTHGIFSRQNAAVATSTRVGATIKVKKVALDWAIGNGAAGGETIGQGSFGFDGGFFSAASLGYSW